MKVFNGRATGGVSELRDSFVSGTVWGDPVMPATEGILINNVVFAPGGRTYWHAHETGQVLHVTAGQGWICVEGRKPEVIRQGDVVWIGPNERHWHGASADSLMVHLAISVGKTSWAEAVAETLYPPGIEAIG